VSPGIPAPYLFGCALLACTPTPDPGHSDPPADSEPAGFTRAQVAEVAAAVHEDMGCLVTVSWEQLEPASAWVEYSFDEDSWLRSPARELQAGPAEQLLLGVPFGADLSYRVVNDFGGGSLLADVGSLSTGDLPAAIPVPELLSSDPEALDASRPWILLSINEIEAMYDGPWWTVIVDRQGRVVWAVATPSTATSLYPRPSFDGSDILVDHNSFWVNFDRGRGSQVRRLKIDGSEVQLHDTPGLAHAFTSLADGSLAWFYDDPDVSELELMSPEGEIETVWGCAEWHASLGVESDCPTNTIAWDEATDTFLLSFFQTDTVVEISRTSGELLRSFGHMADSWAFDPEESAWWWQHGSHYTDTGTLLISTRVSEEGEETVVREYELDEQAQTLRQVWSFGEGLGVYGPTLGEPHRLPNGNTLHNYGSNARLREATPEGELVWDLSLGGMAQCIGRSTPLEDLYAFAP